MEIRFNKEDKSLEINDNFKMHLMLIKLLMIINVLNAVFTFYNNRLAGVQTGWLIIALGFISFIILIFSLKISTVEKVPLEDIDHIIVRNTFGRRRFSFKLKDGKVRNLYLKKVDVNEFEKMIDQLNIKKSPVIN